MRIIPNDKLDMEICNNIFNVSNKYIVDNILDLLEWAEDINWPVARCILKRISVLNMMDIQKPISVILRGDDGCYKYALIVGLLHELNPQKLMSFVDDLKNLAYMPSQEDIDEEIDVYALELLNKIKRNMNAKRANI